MAQTTVKSEQIATNAISGTIIADNAITGVHIAQNAILTQHIDDGQVGTSQLAADAVTGAKLADSSVVTANIQDDQVTGDKLANNITIAGTLASTGVLTANAGVVVDNITIDGTEIDLSSGNLTIDVAGDIVLDADGGDITLNDGGTTFGQIRHQSGDFSFQSNISDKDIKFIGNDGGSDVTALTLDMSDAGTATFNHDVVVSGNISLGDASGATITMNDTDTSQEDFAFVLGANALAMRKASNSNDIMRLDLANERVGIGTASPAVPLDVRGNVNLTADDARLLVEEADGTNIGWFGDITGAGVGGCFLYNHGGTATVQIRADATAGFINNGANFGIGTASPTAPLTVSGTGTGNIVEIISTDAGASTAPDLSFYRNSSSAADSDNIGLIRFYGNDDGGNKTSYAGIHAYIADASDGSSDGGLIFSTTRADTQAPTGAAEALRITQTGDQKLTGGQDLYVDLFADSGTSQGSGSFRFLTDASSAEQSVAGIVMQQEDGTSRKGEILLQVADNGNPATAVKIYNNKDTEVLGRVASKYDADDHVAIRGLSGGQYIQYGSGRPLKFVSVDTYPNSGATVQAQITGGVLQTYNGFSVKKNATTDLSGSAKASYDVKFAAYEYTVTSTNISNGYADVEHKVYRDNYLGQVLSMFDVSANVVYTDLGNGSDWATYARRFASGDITRVGLGNDVVAGDKIKMVVFFHGATG